MLTFLFCTILATLSGDEWNRVYLASFPRSGNHWVRFLVEEATHIATSSIYRDVDFPHLEKKFPWGGYCTPHGYRGDCRYPKRGDPILLKTHYPFLPERVNPTVQQAICLIRHPVDAFWSFYLYEKTGQPLTERKIKEFIAGWRMFYEFWEKQPGVLFIRYEDLQENPALHLDRILRAAGFSFTPSDVERAITQYPPQGKPLKHADRYDSDAIEVIKTELSDILGRVVN